MLRQIIRFSIAVSALIIAACSGEKSADRSSYRAQWIMDEVHLLTKEQKDSIVDVTQTLEREVGSQIVIVIIDSLAGESIEAFSLAKADEIRPGRAKFDDGILISVALSDRMVRIEVGTGLENIIRDEVAAKIIREEIAPEFRRNNYSRGLRKAVQSIADMITENKELVGTRPNWNKN